MFNTWRIDPTNPLVIKCARCTKDFSGPQARRNYSDEESREKANSKCRKHQKTHDRPYRCGSCGLKFTSASDLERHEAIHSDYRARYHCPQRSECGFLGASTSRYLRSHIRANHLEIQLANDPQGELKRICHIQRADAETLVIGSKRAHKLFGYASDCNSEGIREEIAKNVDPNATNKEGYTPLMLVVNSLYSESAKLEAIDTLLFHGANVNSIRTDRKLSALRISATDLAGRHGSTEILQKLVDNGGRLYNHCIDFLRPSISEYESGSSELIQCAIDRKGDPFMPTILFPSDKVRRSRLFLKAGVLRLSNLQRVLPTMIELEYDMSALQLLKFDPDVNYHSRRGPTPLQVAIPKFIETPDTWDPVIRALLDAGADPTLKDSYDVSPLSLAYQSGLEDLILLLEAYKPNNNPRFS